MSHHIMKMREDTVEDVKNMIAMSLSLYTCSVILLMLNTGFGLQSKLVARCLDVNQSAQFSSHYDVLYHKWLAAL